MPLELQYQKQQANLHLPGTFSCKSKQKKEIIINSANKTFISKVSTMYFVTFTVALKVDC